MKPLLVALAGNPNAGKTSLFNAITGSKQHVGNWPGKTIAKKEGNFQYKGHDVNIVDLPGTYSLSVFSPEEVIARDFIVQEKPDVVVTVLDAANLERNLYLAVQVLEMEVPVVVALNMADIAESHPLLPDLLPARSIACSMESVVNTPKTIGIPVSKLTVAIPFETSAHT